MSKIDIEKEIKNYEMSEKKEALIKSVEIGKIKDNMRKPKKIIFMGKPKKMKFVLPKHISKHTEEIREYNNEDEPEIKNGIMTGILKLASLPIKIDRREKLYDNLTKSKFLNRYIENNLYLNWFKSINDDMKAIAIYTYSYIDAIK